MSKMRFTREGTGVKAKIRFILYLKSKSIQVELTNIDFIDALTCGLEVPCTLVKKIDGYAAKPVKKKKGKK